MFRIIHNIVDNEEAVTMVQNIQLNLILNNIMYLYRWLMMLLLTLLKMELYILNCVPLHELMMPKVSEDNSIGI